MILDGVRVIDFSQYIPGSYASLRLKEMGAEVIKVEPLKGDPTREFGESEKEKGIVFAANNRGKKSITLNLKKNEGQNIAKELIQKSDVIIEGFRPGVMKKFNLDYEEVKKYKENIIYLSLSGYGQKGKMSYFGSHDLNYLSLSAVLSQNKDKKGRPVLPKVTFADIIGGMAAGEKILGALFQRERTRLGQYIDLSLMDAVFSLMNFHILTEEKTGKDNVISQLEGELLSYNIYQTKGGRFVSLAALEPKFWHNFCSAVNREDWIPAHLSLQSEDNIIFKELRELFLSKNIAEWTQFSLEVDCCLTPILEVSELKSHPYIIEKELILNQGSYPALGEHNDTILIDLLGKTKAEIQSLKEQWII